MKKDNVAKVCDEKIGFIERSGCLLIDSNSLARYILDYEVDLSHLPRLVLLLLCIDARRKARRAMRGAARKRGAI